MVEELCRNVIWREEERKKSFYAFKKKFGKLDFFSPRSGPVAVVAARSGPVADVAAP